MTTFSPTLRIGRAVPAHHHSQVESLFEQYRQGAARRDRDARLDSDDVSAIAQSGVLVATVPVTEGGWGLPVAGLVELFNALAAADPAATQILLPHFVQVRTILAAGSEQLNAEILPRLLHGGRIGVGASERGTKYAWVPSTRLTGTGDSAVLSGTKYYATGSATADFIGVTALDETDTLVIAIVEPTASGVNVSHDWSSFGQRGTDSGTLTLDSVAVPAHRIIPIGAAPAGPTVEGAFDQLLHTAIDVGIARGALEAAAQFVATRSRPWFESGLDAAADEPQVVHRVGQIAARISVVDAALAKAAENFDDVVDAGLTNSNTAALSIQVAAVKALATEAAVDVANILFEVSGTSATDTGHGLDWFWRNARTHTLHDPIRWKYHHIGNYALSDIAPPRHGLI